MDYVDDDGEPPPELSLAFMCRRWGALPEEGAVMDQDLGLMNRMGAMLNVTDALSALRNSEGAEIHQLTEEQRSILGYLQKLGLIFHE